MTKWIICLSLLIFLPTQSQSQPAKTTMPSGWLAFVKACSAKYGIDPNFALAVAEVESSYKGERFRFGKMGKGTYYGPFGIHKCFLSKWRIDDPYINTEVGIRALSRFKDQRKSLRKYNASFNEAYYQTIKRIEARNRKTKVFEKGENE